MKCSDFTILVAEDDSSALKIYEKTLSAEGYKLILVDSWERVLAELAEKPANLLITDLKMGDMSGFELFPLLVRNHPQLPVIVVSGAYEGLMGNFDKKGFGTVNAFFVKPLNLNGLKQKVREVLKIVE